MTPGANGSIAFGPPTRMIVLGFYDGPTEGVIQFEPDGPAFRFEMPDEDDQLGRRNRAREFLFFPLPPGTVDRLAALLAPYQPPAWPVWCPLWQFPTPVIRAEVEAATDALLRTA